MCISSAGALSQTLKLLKNQLGPESQTKLEEMLKQGMSVEDAIDYFMKHGKTKLEDRVIVCRDFRNKVIPLVA